MKIALVGSAPSSCLLAPYGDKDWKIWGCSPALSVKAKDKHFDLWLEIHPLRPESEFGPGYMKFLREFPGELYFPFEDRQVPNGKRWPRETADEFCHIGRTSTVGWMMMRAITLEPEEIGIWGVDMSHVTEYGEQRLGMQYLIWEARSRGIKVSLPFESDLDVMPLEYGYCFFHPIHRKLTARKQELQGRISAATAERDKHNTQIVYLSGAIENLDYEMKTYPYGTLPDLPTLSNAIGRSPINGLVVGRKRAHSRKAGPDSGPVTGDGACPDRDDP